MKSNSAVLSVKALIEVVHQIKASNANSFVPLASSSSARAGLSVSSLTTRPIAMPTVDPDLSRLKKLLAAGKGYVSLYKNGIKNVWNNQKRANELKKKYNFKSIPELSQYIAINSALSTRDVFASDSKTIEASPQSTPSQRTSSQSTSSQSTSTSGLTRSDYQLLLRTKKDIKKLPPFAVIFAIFFECTPLIVFMFPRITPLTCYTPVALRKHNERRDKSVRDLHELEKTHLKSDPSQSEHELIKEYSRSVYNMSREELERLARFSGKLTLHSKVYRTSTLRSKIDEYITEIRCDNELFLRSLDEFLLLDEYELSNACLDRSIPIHNKTLLQMRGDLLRWILTFKKNRYDAGIFLHAVPGTTEPEAGKVLESLRQTDQNNV